jgi:hypothetical protein
VQRIERAGLDYQAFYCEENVWRLLARPEFEDAASWAVIVSSCPRDVVLLRQLSGRPVDGLVHWDYHVFAVANEPMAGPCRPRPGQRAALSLSPRPLSGGHFPEGVQRAFAPRFRVMRGATTSADLVSDRSHMRRPDGSWIARRRPGPLRAPWTAARAVLMEWIDVGLRQPGALYDTARMAAFRGRFGA